MATLLSSLRFCHILLTSLWDVVLQGECKRTDVAIIIPFKFEKRSDLSSDLALNLFLVILKGVIEEK